LSILDFYFFCLKLCTNLRDFFIFYYFKWKNTAFALDFDPILFFGKKHYSSSYIVSSLKAAFFCLQSWLFKFQNCYNLKIQWSIFTKINSIHTRQSSLYFCMVKIKIFKHIHVQKKIKVGWFIQNLHCQNIVRPWGVKQSRTPQWKSR